MVSTRVEGSHSEASSRATHTGCVHPSLTAGHALGYRLWLGGYAMDILTRQKARFGSFELDSQTGELFKEDERINLHGQPIEILSLLLDHPGELVPREVIRHRLWPKDTFVDFEH